MLSVPIQLSCRNVLVLLSWRAEGQSFTDVSLPGLEAGVADPEG